MNCDQSEEVSSKIQKSLDNLDFTAAKIKCTKNVKRLASFQLPIKVFDEEVCVDPMTLFSWLLAYLVTFLVTRLECFPSDNF